MPSPLLNNHPTAALLRKLAKAEAAGLTRAQVETLYRDQGLSNTELAATLRATYGQAFNRGEMTALLLHYSIPLRTAEEIEERRQAKIKAAYEAKTQEDLRIYTREALDRLLSEEQQEETLRLYGNGVGLRTIASHFNVSETAVRKVLEYNDVPLKAMRTSYKELLKQLALLGWDKARINSEYNGEMNRSPQEMATVLTQALGQEVTSRQFERMVRELGIQKPKELLAAKQGARSREELKESLARLEKAGHTSPQKLAAYFEAHKALTYEGLAAELNSKLLPTEPQFTTRWLERHMTPHLDSERMKGTSRAELSLKAELTRMLPAGVTLKSHERSLIYPYEVDLYLPELALAIEFNGTYWHSDKFLQLSHNMTAEDYHRLKQEKCAAKGVRLVFVWESDWEAPLLNELIVVQLASLLKDRIAPAPLLERLARPVTLPARHAHLFKPEEG